MKRFLTVMSLLMVLFLNAQVGIGIINPESSAMLDVTSTSKGFLPPRMTYAQRSTITSPAIGLIIFCTNCGSASVGGELQVFSGGIWRNLAGTAASFATPTIASTIAASNISFTTATSGGNITSDGGSTISARGVCWSTSQNPTIANSKTIDAGTTGTFTSSLTGLTLNTLYYVRSYATNSSGTSYGTQISFTTLNTQPTAGSLNFTAAGSNISNGSVTWSTTSYLDMSPGLKFGAGAFTIEFWFNTSNFTSRGILGGDNAISGFLNLHFDHDKSITVDKNCINYNYIGSTTERYVCIILYEV